MLKHCVVKGRHVMKPLHVCLIVLQYYARVATGRAGYVLYRALVIQVVCGNSLNEHVLNKYSVRTRYFRESRSMRAEYKRGVVRPEVLDHAHKYGG